MHAGGSSLLYIEVVGDLRKMYIYNKTWLQKWDKTFTDMSEMAFKLSQA